MKIPIIMSMSHGRERQVRRNKRCSIKKVIQAVVLFYSCDKKR